MINKIGKITVYVNDQEEAKKFWTEKMDFVVSFEQQMGPGFTWLEVSPNNHAITSFVLYNKQVMKQQSPETNVEHPSVLLSTVDVESAHKKMKANGVEVEAIMNMPYGKMFSFKDQDGNAYILREDK